MSYEYERVATPASGLRLHLNENTAGCSPRVIEVLRGLSREQAAFYPDYEAPVAAAARWLHVAPEQLLLTNGLDEGILAISVAALRGAAAASPFEAIVIVPAFDMYAACTDAAGGRVIEVPLGADFAFPLPEVIGAIGERTRLIFLTNPNNPTGQPIPRDAIEQVAAAASGAMVLVDEAYAEFAGETLIAPDTFRRFPNVIVGRTFAKAYGLAGLRVGALVGAPEALAPLRRIIPPYTLNACAALALPAALDDRRYVEAYLEQVRQSKAMLYAAFDRLGVKYWRSAANFVFACFGARCRAVVDGLADRQIYVRDRSADAGCAGCVRITAGIADHTRALIAALEEVSCAEP
jgi:histidinol-phosphate aminotransferase